MTASVPPNVRKSSRGVRIAAVRPPARPPMVVATSSAMPRRMFTRPRSRLMVDEADAVAMTEIRLAAMAVRIGNPRVRVRSGTRKTPPPRPRRAPMSPVAAPIITSTSVWTAITAAS
jgi:hypothetical protein